MKLSKVIAVGHLAGCKSTEECLAYFEVHAMRLIPNWYLIPGETKELRDECMANGIDYDGFMENFSRALGHPEPERIGYRFDRKTGKNKEAHHGITW
jgi:hypothetical protein